MFEMILLLEVIHEWHAVIIREEQQAVTSWQLQHSLWRVLRDQLLCQSVFAQWKARYTRRVTYQ